MHLTRTGPERPAMLLPAMPDSPMVAVVCGSRSDLPTLKGARLTR